MLVENAAEALANLIMNLVRMIDPDTVVLGGGIVAEGYMHEKILEKLHPTTMRFVDVYKRQLPACPGCGR